MSRILRRAKSTRDARAKLTRDQRDLNFAAEVQTWAPLRARAEEEARPSSPGMLNRRKSISSFHASLRMGDILGNIPKTATPLNRPSVLPGGRSTPLLGSPPASATGLSSFPPRQISDGVADGSGRPPGTGLEDDCEHCCIGVAIGSPTEDRAARMESPAVSLALDLPSSDSGTPQFTLPPKPFGVEVRGPMSGALRNKSHQRESGQKSVAQEENPKIGWRKLFGRSFFGKKSTPKPTQKPSQQLPLQAPIPYEPRPVKSKTPYLISRSHLNNLPAPPVSLAPCLDVDIPEVEMERYSVMFGTLLHPSEKSSLFARRRSRDITNANNGQQEVRVPQLYLSPLKRNATTGQVSRSPRPMLGDSLPGPSPRSVVNPARSPEQLARSKTVGGVSPVPPPSPRTIYVVNSHSSSTLTSPSRPCSLRRNSSSKISRISEESSIDTPAGSFDEGDDTAWLNGDIKNNDGRTECQWDMISPENRSTPMSEEDIEYAAQVSIARQITVSRRQLLLPIVPRSQRLVSRAPLKKPPKPLLARNITPGASGAASAQAGPMAEGVGSAR